MRAMSLARTEWVGLALYVAVALVATACDEPEEPLPEMIPISDFELLDQDGQEFSSRSLRGKVWIADLIFTSCPEICPVMSTQMSNLSRRITHEDVHFVSLSVDPEVDTPEVLHAYAERFGADTERWTFLTGSEEDVQRVISRSFRLPSGDRFDREDGRYDILHTARFILVDQHMTMRGLYETDRDGLDRLERDVERLREP